MVRGTRVIMKLKIVAEHVQQVFFKPHDQRVHPCVKDHIRTFPAHLRRVAGGEILNMDGGRDHRARNAKAFADMAFHLGAQDHFGLQRGNGGFNLQIVVGNQRLDPVVFRQGADRAGHFAVKAAKACHFEAHFFARNAGGGGDMGAVAKDKHALAGEIGAVNAACPPRQAQARGVGFRSKTGDLGHFSQKIARRPNTDRDGLGVGLLEIRL